MIREVHKADAESGAYLWRRGQAAEAAESLEQNALVDHGIQVSDEELSTHVQSLLLIC
jgi:hypothetical protein